MPNKSTNVQYPVRPSDSPTGSSKKSAPLLRCGYSCWRYLTDQDKPEQSRYTCFVGSSQGANITPGHNCVWGYTLETGIDRGLPPENTGLINPTPADEDALAHHQKKRKHAQRLTSDIPRLMTDTDMPYLSTADRVQFAPELRRCNPPKKC